MGDGVAATSRTEVRIAVGERDFSLLQNLKTDSRVNSASYSVGTAVEA
jgi:hypothetical protein